MDAATRRHVRRRAGERCEYCHLPQSAQPFVSFHIEHIVAKQHGGSDDPANLCLACHRCNAFKGPNLAGVDPATGRVEPLFNPRVQSWPEHFALRGALIVGLSPVGRATAEVLVLNEARRTLLRADLIARGEF